MRRICLSSMLTDLKEFRMR
ncbi:UNVERIFIED_CONTAM: hypothetical protein GTU68_007751 [Idotea baltica]|nr:hypothetical protein [Idotea baltica]